MTATLWYCSLVITYVLAAIQSYACYHFHSLRSLLIIQKRYPQLIIAEAVAVLIWLLIPIPLWSSNLFKATKFGMTRKEYNIYKMIVLSTVTAMTHFVAIIEVSRLWLISFDLHCLHSSQNEKWKSQIDESTKKDWYLKHRNTFGNQKYLIRRVLFYYLCVASLSSSLYCITYTMKTPDRFVFVATLTDGFFYSISLGASLYIYYKCRNFHLLNDNLYFWYEIRATSIIWAIAIICYFIVQPLYWFFQKNDTIKAVSDCFFIAASLFAIVAPSFLSMIVIPRKISQSNVWNKEFNDETYALVPVSPVASKSIDFQDVEDNFDLLRETLQDKTKFELFIQWMYKEFSAEAGLCFIEMVQFKQSLMSELRKKGQKVDNEYENLLYDSVPKSSIVFVELKDVDGIAKYKSIAHRLFEKYIRPNAEFEINISHHTRAKYVKMDKNNWGMEQNKFAKVFDGIVEEMFLFMRQSFNRYQQQP